MLAFFFFSPKHPKMQTERNVRQQVSFRVGLPRCKRYWFCIAWFFCFRVRCRLNTPPHHYRKRPISHGAMVSLNNFWPRPNEQIAATFASWKENDQTSTQCVLAEPHPTPRAKMNARTQLLTTDYTSERIFFTSSAAFQHGALGTKPRATVGNPWNDWQIVEAGLFPRKGVHMPRFPRC